MPVGTLVDQRRRAPRAVVLLVPREPSRPCFTASSVTSGGSSRLPTLSPSPPPAPGRVLKIVLGPKPWTPGFCPAPIRSVPGAADQRADWRRGHDSGAAQRQHEPAPHVRPQIAAPGTVDRQLYRPFDTGVHLLRERRESHRGAVRDRDGLARRFHCAPTTRSTPFDNTAAAGKEGLPPMGAASRLF